MIDMKKWGYLKPVKVEVRLDEIEDFISKVDNLIEEHRTLIVNDYGGTSQLLLLLEDVDRLEEAAYDMRKAINDAKYKS